MTGDKNALKNYKKIFNGYIFHRWRTIKFEYIGQYIGNINGYKIMLMMYYMYLLSRKTYYNKALERGSL
jgi:hypothetical protein